MRYADPSLCPDCRSDVPRGTDSCPTCGLVLRHRLGVELFRTLTHADQLLAELRAFSDAPRPTPAAAPVPPAPPAPPAASVPPAPPAPPAAQVPLPQFPAATPVPPTPRRTGLSSASVPKILLGLGALCLLVAAIIFLAVSWSYLGVGGRTAVLAGLTLAAGAAALGLHRLGLRIAGESLSVVALGLLALDVIGAGAAGWFGDPAADTVWFATGLVVAVVAGGMGALRLSGRPRLAAPQIITGIALLTVDGAAASMTGHHLITAHVMVALILGIVLLARLTDMTPLLWSAAVAGGLIWLSGATTGLVQALDDPTLRQLWVEGTGWSLLATAVALVAPGLIARHRTTTLIGVSCGAMIVTTVVTLPTTDSGATVFGIVSLAVTLGWAAALAVLPAPWRIVAAPAATGALLLAGQLLIGLSFALARWGDIAGRFDRSFDVAFDRPDQVVEAAILVPATLAVLLVIALLLPNQRQHLAGWLRAAGVGVGLSGSATLASYDVPLVSVVALLAVTAVATVVTAHLTVGTSGDLLTVAGLVVAGVAAGLAVPNDVLALGAALVASLLAAQVAFGGRSRGRQLIGGIGLPIGLSATVGAVTSVAGADTAWLAVPVLVVAWLPALGRPRIELEVTATAVSILVLPGSLADADRPMSLLALWLAVAGCIGCASALLHESRRPLGAAGATLLLLASWVRLADLEVTAPEAYTLPLAAIMTGIGLYHLRRHPDAGTAPALLPGLLVAVLPSLLWVFADPVSLRALVLGAGCLALTIAGAVLRWSAPLVVGAVCGAALVLREIGPYADVVPQWVWIGLAGALLTVVGITWERQLLEMRKAVGAIGRLR